MAMESKRVKRKFDIRVQSAPSDPVGRAAPPKRKYTRRYTPEQRKENSKIKVNPLVNEVTQFFDKKITHCTLAVQKDPDGKQSQRYFSLSSDSSPDDEDSDRDDRYDSSDDEEEDVYRPRTDKKGLRLKSSKKNTTETAEPIYEQTGGVLWYILDKLGSKTKFTNSEVRHEGQRAWGRYKGSKLHSNQKICILLAIEIRSRQARFVEILNGRGQKIVVKSGKSYMM